MSKIVKCRKSYSNFHLPHHCSFFYLLRALVGTGMSLNKSEFCFPETFNVPQREAKRNIEVERKQNSLFSGEPVIIKAGINVNLSEI